ncbi:hypothetical protein C0J52_12171 [Blattella germanica]|nr:hypothetical protein C0J52_12171 [Blattella germanica]
MSLEMPQYKQPLSLVQLTLKSLEDFVLLLGYQLMSIACKPPSEEQWTSIKCFLQPGLPLSIANRLTEHLLGVLTVIAQEAGNVMYCYHLDELDREMI